MVRLEGAVVLSLVYSCSVEWNTSWNPDVRNEVPGPLKAITVSSEAWMQIGGV